MTALYHVSAGDSVVYVGRTSNLKSRTAQHRSLAKKNSHPLYEWWRDQVRTNRPVQIVVVKECEGDGYDDEKNEIARLRESGFVLFNQSRGGEGKLGPSALPVQCRLREDEVEELDRLAQSQSVPVDRATMVAHIVRQFLREHGKPAPRSKQ